MSKDFKDILSQFSEEESVKLNNNVSDLNSLLSERERRNFALKKFGKVKDLSYPETDEEKKAVARVVEEALVVSSYEKNDERGDFISMPALSDEEDLVGEDNFALPENYINRYNLERENGDPVDVYKALEISVNKLGKVDVEYISSLSLLSLKDVVLKLRGKIFKDPNGKGQYFYENYYTEDEYLSGNVYQKYKDALLAEESHKGMYKSNISALCAILPPKPKFEDIHFALGAPFIPAHYIAEFVQYLYRMSLVKNKRICEVVYEKYSHHWAVILNIDARSTVLASKTYGTERINMFKILEKTLNHEQIRITDAEDGSDKKTRKFNREQTMLAEEKRTRLNEAFARWLCQLSDEEKQELTDIYYEKYCCFVSRNFEKSKVELSDKPLSVELYDYQERAVKRIISSPSTLLAHDVGSGKTYVMITACHEIKNKDKNSKTMIVVPNSILMQWKEDYMFLYPDAKILVVTPNDFTPEKRLVTIRKMQNDYEAILIAYSTFEMIPAGGSWAIGRLTREIGLIDEEIKKSAIKRSAVRIKIVALLNKEREKLNKIANSLVLKDKNDFTFEDLGVTSLFVDEAHNYKNLPLDSSLGQIKGINPEGSKKCADVYLKTKITEAKENSHVVFATGTPVTNSVADVFVMQKYLSEEILKDCDIDYFDNWAGTFGEITCAYEIDVDTDSYRLSSRFNKFNNLSELSSMINLFTDFHVESKDGLPEVERVVTIAVKKTNLQIELLGEISKRVDDIRSGAVDKKQDNLLKVTTDGRKIALDSRLVGCDRGVTGRKISACALEVSKLYYKYSGKTQLVFCDIGTPKQGYNVYDDLKSRLIEYGIDEDSIGFVHDATSEERRAKMFESVNNGAIRVLIGSTFKLGTGVNVQERLVAIHHLDVPWRPSDMVQREGRLVRRGNTNEKVFIYRYVTDGSFDAYSWQLLENKQRFITELLTGTASGQDERKLDDAVLSYAEVKALAVGNPLVKNRVEIVNELARIKTLLKEEKKKQSEVNNLKLSLPEKIAQEKVKLEAVKDDIKRVEKNPEIADKGPIGDLIAKTIAQNAMSLAEVYICDINGFKLYLPANFNKIRPYLVLVGEMRYTVNIVTFSIGAVIKIENFLNSLDKIENKFSDEIEELEMKLKTAIFDDSLLDEYQRKIEVLSEKLKKIDEELGL